jgi:hypothetical protein
MWGFYPQSAGSPREAKLRLSDLGLPGCLAGVRVRVGFVVSEPRGYLDNWFLRATRIHDRQFPYHERLPTTGICVEPNPPTPETKPLQRPNHSRPWMLGAVLEKNLGDFLKYRCSPKCIFEIPLTEILCDMRRYLSCAAIYPPMRSMKLVRNMSGNRSLGITIVQARDSIGYCQTSERQSFC